jgi:hypothetical protein
MSRRVNHLSAVLIKSLSHPGYYGDGTGLYLQVSVSGSTRWNVRFRMADPHSLWQRGPMTIPMAC